MANEIEYLSGEAIAYVTEGKTVYEIPEMFADWGIYLAETREEYGDN